MSQSPQASGSKRGLAAIVGSVAAAGALLWFVPSQEGTVLKTYRDMAGVLTYCTGATEDAQFGKIYTPEECRAQLDKDLARHADGIVDCLGPTAWNGLTDGKRVAYVDLAFNIGVQAFCGSSVAKMTRAGRLDEACDAILLWNRAGGHEVAGLTKRRQRERDYCLKGLQ